MGNTCNSCHTEQAAAQPIFVDVVEDAEHNKPRNLYEYAAIASEDSTCADNASDVAVDACTNEDTDTESNLSARANLPGHVAFAGQGSAVHGKGHSEKTKQHNKQIHSRFIAR